MELVIKPQMRSMILDYVLEEYQNSYHEFGDDWWGCYDEYDINIWWEDIPNMYVVTAYALKDGETDTSNYTFITYLTSK